MNDNVTRKKNRYSVQQLITMKNYLCNNWYVRGVECVDIVNIFNIINIDPCNNFYVMVTRSINIFDTISCHPCSYWEVGITV